jgi:iron complex transport system substrate-binding protein
VFLFCLISFSLLTPTGESARLVVDQAGREVRVPDDPQRVIALAPSLTEMVYALGAESQLHGVTEFSNFPDAARALPRVGSYIRPDVEKIVALRPDLCLAIRDGNPRHVAEKIAGLGIPIYVVDPRNLQGIMETITGIGDVLGVPEKAVALVRDMRSRIDRVKARVAGTTGRPEVFFQIAVAPIVSVGTNTFIHELIQMAGGVNLTAGAVPYPRVTWEEILFLQPEITIISSMAGGHSPENLKSEWTRWQQLPSVRTGRVYVVDANLFDRPTTRLVEGLEVLVDIIHPKVTARTEETGGR